VTDGGRHASHLAVASLDEHELDPRRGDALPEADRDGPRGQRRLAAQPPDARRTRPAALDDHAPRERVERGCIGLALDLHLVGARMAVLRVRQRVRESSVVAQEQEPLAVVVEPADRPNARHRHELGEAGVPRLRGEARNGAVGLPERDQRGCSRRPQDAALAMTPGRASV
jgi:hypothetical protein